MNISLVPNNYARVRTEVVHVLKEILGKHPFSPNLLSCRCVSDTLSNLCTCWLLLACLCAKINEILHRFQGLSLTSDMKPAHHTLFRDQVSTLVEWFANWNDCEQTIALYTLLKRISTIQARFLSLILEHTFRDNSFEVQMMQRRANDKGNIFLSGARGRVNSGLSCSTPLVLLHVSG